MRVVLLTTTEAPEPWYKQYLQGACEGLVKRDIRFLLEDGDAPEPEREPGDVFLCTHWRVNERIPNLPPRSAIIVEHNTSCPMEGTGFDTSWYRHPNTLLVTGVSPGQVPWLARDAEDTTVTWLGFPYPHHAKPTGPLRTRKFPPQGRGFWKIVFGMSFRETNSVYAAVTLADMLIQDHRVVFHASAYPDRYPVDEWRRMGIEVIEGNQQSFYNTLEGADYYVSTTNSGSLTVSAYEAFLRGVRPIVPRGRSRSKGLVLPPFNEPYDPTYPVYDLEKARVLIQSGKYVYVDQSYFDPFRWAGDLKEAVLRVRAHKEKL